MLVETVIDRGTSGSPMRTKRHNCNLSPSREATTAMPQSYPIDTCLMERINTPQELSKLRVYGDSLLNTALWPRLALDQLFAGEELQMLVETVIARGTSGSPMRTKRHNCNLSPSREATTAMPQSYPIDTCLMERINTPQELSKLSP